MGRGFGISAQVDEGVVRAVAREAERLGYTSFWVNDVPHAEGLVSLAAAAAVTSRLDLGVGVVPLDQRPPASIAERVRSLGLPPDRLVLGVGSGAPQEGVARVRAGVARLQEELGVRVVVGALGPRMCTLAGEVADGALLNWMTVEHAERAGRWVREAAATAGRPAPSLRLYVRCGSLPGAAGRLQEELRRYVGLAHFDRHQERMGAAAAETCVLAEGPDDLQAGIARFEPLLDDTIVRAVTPDDSADTLLALLGDCAPGGVRPAG